MLFIGQSVSQVFFERASRERNNPIELKRITFSLYKKLLLIGAIMISVITFYGDLLFPFIFGDSWKTAGKYAQWMSIWVIFILCVSPLSNLFLVLEKQGSLVVFNVFLIICKIGIIIWTSIIGTTDIQMVAFFSIICSIMYFCLGIHLLRLMNISICTIITSSIGILSIVFLLQFGGFLILRNFLSGKI
jgi:O-antigen/teichoic acid export membrane protein